MKSFIKGLAIACLVIVCVFGFSLGIARLGVPGQRIACEITQEYIHEAYWQDNGAFNYGCYVDLNESLRIKLNYVEEK
jgi:hypothetical protein